jgi:uncharacterized BrkB/YihY/UPF0761 family membrane protein
MNDDKTLASLGITFFVILCIIGSVFGFLNMGSYFGAKEAKNQTTIECIEKPELCKQRYEFIKLREKLGEN